MFLQGQQAMKCNRVTLAPFFARKSYHTLSYGNVQWHNGLSGSCSRTLTLSSHDARVFRTPPSAILIPCFRSLLPQTDIRDSFKLDHSMSWNTLGPGDRARSPSAWRLAGSRMALILDEQKTHHGQAAFKSWRFGLERSSQQFPAQIDSVEQH